MTNKTEAESFSSPPDPPELPFRRRGGLPESLQVPRWLAASVLLGFAAGASLGLWTGGGGATTVVRALFFSSAFAYLIVSLFDFAEHFRLEKLATGRYIAAAVVPWGESLNHAATGLTLVLMFVLARPVRPPLALRDWYCLFAPMLFLVLGWRDELVYHRRRCAHREDIMHTTAHLAAGTMLASFVAMRMVPW